MEYWNLSTIGYELDQFLFLYIIKEDQIFMKIFLASSTQKQEHWEDTILFFEAVNLEYDYDKGL